MPGVTTPFGHIGGIAGYPITTAPTTTTQIGSSLTQTRGSHTMKIGGAFDYGYNRSVRNQARTSLTANGSTSGDVDALVGLLLARFENAARSFGSTERKMGQTSVGVFFNDDWRVTPRLTVSGGLRYEVTSPVSEQNNLATNFFPDKGLVQLGTNGLDKLYKADKNNFGPRAGLAWDPTGSGRTSVRVGYALTYDTALIGTVHPGLFSTPTLGVFRVAFAQTPRFVPGSGGCHLPQSEQFGGGRRLRLPAAGRTGVRLVADGRAAVQHLQSPRRFPLGLLPLLPRDDAARAVPEQLGDRVLRGVARQRSRHAARDQRAAARLADDERRSIAAGRSSRSTRNSGTSRSSPTTPSRGTTASSSRSGRTSGTASTRSTTTRCRSARIDNSSSRGGINGQAHSPYDPSNNEGPCTSDIRHNFNFGGSYAIPGTHAQRRPAPDRRRVHRVVGPAVHAWRRHLRSVRPGHGHDSRRLSGGADLQLRPRLSVPRLEHDAVGRDQPRAGVHDACGRQARHLRPQQRTASELRAARHEHHQGVQNRRATSGFRCAGRSST